jgi:IclR family KDG regulon transcriptional repressor
LELGAKAGAQFDLVTEARPLVKKLSMETQRTCHVAILDHNDVIYVVKENTHCLIRIDTWVGKRVGVYCTASGKTLLAWKNEWEAKAIIDSVQFEKIAPNTITDKETFLKVLPEVRERGWALDDEEAAKMVRSVAAPIFNQKGEVYAALSVSTLTELDNYEEMLGITDKVVRCAKEMSEKLGAVNNISKYPLPN